MPIEIKIPQVGESITEVQIAEWLKAEGDAVQKDESVAVIDSEKTTFELPAPEAGTLGKILRQAGVTVKVGEVIAHLNDGAAPATAKAAVQSPPTAQTEKGKAPAPAAVADKPQDAQAASEAPVERAPDQTKSQPTKPAATKSTPPAESDETERKEELSTDDAKPEAQAAVKPASRPAPKPSTSNTVGTEEEIVPMSMLRRTVARRLVEAKQQMAMLTTFNEVDMSAAQAFRHEHKEAFEKRHGVKLGLMSFFVKAAVDALKQIPKLNAEVRGNDIVYRNTFHLGVAIASERGLVVPVLRHAERLSFADVEKAIGDFAGRAKTGKLKPDELEGATFTITNGGVFGSLLSTPIISPPQSGILGMHTIQERPVAVQGQVVIRPMMYLALTYDHRIVDGREAVLFLRRIKEVIENPARMLVEV